MVKTIHFPNARWAGMHKANSLGQAPGSGVGPLPLPLAKPWEEGHVEVLIRAVCEGEVRSGVLEGGEADETISEILQRHSEGVVRDRRTGFVVHDVDEYAGRL